MSYAEYKGTLASEFYIPVTLFNSNNGKSIIVNSNVDTASWTVFDSSVAESLGLNIQSGYHNFSRNDGEDVFWLHRLPLQIGNLRPVIADVYFGNKKLTHEFVKKQNMGTIGWANNGGLNNFIMDVDIKNIKFTDYSFINSLPRPVNRYTIVKYSPPRLVGTGYEDEIIYNQQPYHDTIFYNKETNNPVKIKTMVDTGAVFSILNSNYAEQLGIDDISTGRMREFPSSGGGESLILYMHDINIKIGDLAPMSTSIGFPDYYSDFHVNILGNFTIYNYKLRFMKDRMMYEENPKPVIPQHVIPTKNRHPSFAYYLRGHNNRDRF